MADETLPKGGPTPTEAIFFFHIVQHMKNKGDIDWNAVAESSGFKNASVARTRFNQIKRKYGLDSESLIKRNSGEQQPLPPTPTKVTKRKGGGGGGGRRGARAVKKEEGLVGGDDNDVDGDDAAAAAAHHAGTVKDEFLTGNRIKREQASDGSVYI